MKSTNNFIFITLEKEFSDKIVGPAGKLELDLMSFKDNIVDKDDEVIYNVNEKRINYGTVIAVPEKLTREENILQEDPGKPEPTRYISHDQVMMAPKFLSYDPGTYVAKWKTTADIVPEVQVGDRVYFHFNTLDPENRVTLPDGRTFYKLAYQNALCVVRKGMIIKINFNAIEQVNGKAPKEILDIYFRTGILTYKEKGEVKTEHIDNIAKGGPVEKMDDFIIPIGGNVLIEPEYEDGVVDIGIGGTKGKISTSGIVTELGVRPKALRGIVRHVGEPLRGHVREVNPGDRIVYQKHSDWMVKVEGVEYYCMKQWDIEGIITE